MAKSIKPKMASSMDPMMASFPTSRWRSVCDAMAEMVSLDWNRAGASDHSATVALVHDSTPGELFEALVLHESGGDSRAINTNGEGDPLRWDYGLCQINGLTFCDLLAGTEFYSRLIAALRDTGSPELFLRRALLLPLRNLSFGLQRLLQCLQRAQGDLTKALGCYNGDRTGAYSGRVLEALERVRKDRSAKEADPGRVHGPVGILR